MSVIACSRQLLGAEHDITVPAQVELAPDD